MEETKLTNLSIEGKKMITDLIDKIDEIKQWLANEGTQTLNGLHDRWQSLCESVKTAQSRKFIESIGQCDGQCDSILECCIAFEEEISEINEKFIESTKELIPKMETFSDGDELKTLLNNTIEHLWNKTVLKQLMKLYKSASDLETNILNTISLGMAEK